MGILTRLTDKGQTAKQTDTNINNCSLWFMRDKWYNYSYKNCMFKTLEMVLLLWRMKNFSFVVSNFFYFLYDNFIHYKNFVPSLFKIIADAPLAPRGFFIQMGKKGLKNSLRPSQNLCRFFLKKENSISSVVFEILSFTKWKPSYFKYWIYLPAQLLKNYSTTNKCICIDV